jgi:hypothetical protein
VGRSISPSSRTKANAIATEVGAAVAQCRKTAKALVLSASEIDYSLADRQRGDRVVAAH